MSASRQEIVDAFFKAYASRDMAGIRAVMHDDATWYFIGRHPYAGIKKGIDEVVAFFDSMGKIMGESKPTIEKPIVSENERYLIECVHTKSNREGGPNLDHYATVLWTFKDDKIIEGRHFFADPIAVDEFFSTVKT
jgi:ketosteroid isomerase-like protein